MHTMLQLIVLACLGCCVLASPQQELLQQQPTAVIQPATPLNDTAIPLNTSVRPLSAAVAANSAQAAGANKSSVTKAAGTAAALGAAAGLERAGASLPTTIPATVVAAQPATATQNPTGPLPAVGAQAQAISGVPVGIPGQHLPASASAQASATAQSATPAVQGAAPASASKQPAQASKRPKEPDYAAAFVEPTLAGTADVDTSTVPGQQGLPGTAAVLHATRQNGTRTATAVATVASLLARAKAAAAAATARGHASVQHVAVRPGANVSAVQAERGTRPGNGALGRNTTNNSTAAVEVTLLHFNDWHVRVESTKGSWCGLCTEYDVKKGRCSGGLARMATFIKQQRQLDPDLLLLNAGDDFIGTEWDRKAGLDAPAAFMNMLEVDAMTIGNHEWDKGLDSLKEYLDACDNKAVLGANIDFQGHDLKNKVKPYVIKQVKGKKVCILGLTTMYGLPGSSQMGAVKIQEPYSAGRKILEELKGKGCHAKVLLSHLGYTSDLVAANAIPGLDLIIGGHSHSFLWPEPDSPPAFYKPDTIKDGSCCSKQSGPEYDVTWGPYPTYVHSNGKQVPVVQASWGSRYMGKLVLRFKPEEEGGKLDGIESEIVLLGGPNSEQHVPEDEGALEEIKKWRHW